MARPDALVWRRIYWPRPLGVEPVTALLRTLAADQRSPRVAFEARSFDGRATEYWVGASASVIDGLATTLLHLVPGSSVIRIDEKRLPGVQLVRRLKANTRHRPVNVASSEATARAVLSALQRVRTGEQLVIQVILGPRRVPLAIPTTSPSSIVAPWWEIAWRGNGKQVDSEKRAALRTKVSLHGFACTVRLGITADNERRRQLLLLGLMAALRTSETAGLQLRLRHESAERLNKSLSPWRWPLRLNAAELVSLLGWPIGDGELPGVPAAHPKLLPPAPGTTGTDRIVGAATAPGETASLVLRPSDALHHLHVVGPTGSGKSVLLQSLIGADIAAGRGCVVIEPKDLVDDVLARIPPSRHEDVVVLDASDNRPVGLNPLNSTGRNPDVVADGILSVFKALYADAWGPRTQDILHACLLTLARRPDASLVMLPLLLTNAGFRRSLIHNINDPIALGPFWSWYGNLSEGERQQAIAPVMNKLRQWLLRPSLRAVLGQRQPSFTLRQVFTERKILLVPLRKGLIGPEAAALLGSLVVAELWQTILERTAIPAERRHPVMVYIDEVQDYLHLPTDLGDALAQARGLGVGFTLAHQFLGQLPREMKEGTLTNARSRVCFRLAQDDAVAMAKGHPELAADDLTALSSYEIYSSLFARGTATPYASARTLAPSPATTDVGSLRAQSRSRFGQPLDEIEAGFLELINGSDPKQPTTGRRRRSS
jgi:energy-coupling factor transporter ATP-binding protein EcfA2